VTQRPCSADELRALFLFEKLTDDQLDWLCQRGRAESFPAGPVYAEGDPASCFFVLLGGTVVLSRRVGADDVEICRTSQPGAHAGAWQAYLGDRVPQLYTNSRHVAQAGRDRDRGRAVRPRHPGDAHQASGGGRQPELLIKEIEDSTTRISTLVGAAKQYSQLDRDPYQIIDVHELLDSTLLVLRGTIPAGIRVVKEYERSCPAIPAYANELNEAWTNLIDNAVSAMGEAGVLTVRTGMDRDQVVVVIGDTGPGVPAEIRDRIFDPLFTTKPVGQGSGLGLDVTWRIVVNNHHGDIQVESVPGNTQFRVRLPTS
jgi:signal transduction histidine kinase